MKFKAIFFDNDGLLVNTEALFFQATREVYAMSGIEVTREWYMNESLGKGVSSIELLSMHGLDNAAIQAVRTKRDERYWELIQKDVPVVDGVRETLPLLKGKIVMGVVTSSNRREFNLMMEKTGLDSFFSVHLWEQTPRLQTNLSR